MNMSKIPLRVLYVEDARVSDQNTIDVISDMFYEIVIATNGEDGLDKYKLRHSSATPFDLIIANINLPLINGFEMMRQMRTVNKDIHVVVISESGFSAYIDDINMLCKFNQYIEKPISQNRLRPLITSILQDMELRGEQRLQYSLTKQYQNAIDNSAIVTKTNKAGIITYVNDAFCAISGYTREELVGKPHSIVRDPSIPSEFFANLWATIKAKMIFKHPSIPNKAKNGDIYYVDTTILPILDQDRDIAEYLSIRFDTTALEHQIRADRNAIQSQEKFLANMSHEIRTPLNGILGFSKLLSEQIKEPELKEYAEIINQSGTNLLALMNQILDLAKVQSGNMELDKIWISVNREFELIKNLFEVNAREKNIDLVYEIACLCEDCSKTVDILADGLKLKQIVSNLLSNAIKFTKIGGKIIFSISKIASNDKVITLRFSVKDNGIGITKEKQNQIFEPFKQADLSTTRQYGGTGLGLSLSRDFVKLFGSKLELKSEPNVGSEFYFDVDFEYRCRDNYETSGENIQNNTKLQSNNQTISGNILVAEDVVINQKLIDILLKSFGINGFYVTNGEEAVEFFKENYHNIDCVILDINMPIMDGLEACKRINLFKQQQGIENIPLIALTANTMDGDKEKYLESGFDEYLSKPIVKDKLMEILECCFATKQHCVADEVESCKDIDIVAPQNTTIQQFDFEEIANKLSLPIEFYNELFGDFCKLLEKDMPLLEVAIEEENGKDIKEISHKLKGVAGNLGLDILFERFKLMEVELEANQYIKIGMLYRSVKSLMKGFY